MSIAEKFPIEEPSILYFPRHDDECAKVDIWDLPAMVQVEDGGNNEQTRKYTEARAYTFSGVTTPVWSCRQAQKKEVKRLPQTHQSLLTAIVPTPTPKRQKRVTQENALVHQKNIKIF